MLGGGGQICSVHSTTTTGAATGTSRAVGVADRSAGRVVVAVAAAGRGEAAVVASDAPVGGG